MPLSDGSDSWRATEGDRVVPQYRGANERADDWTVSARNGVPKMRIGNLVQKRLSTCLRSAWKKKL
jgi:hypothetical protein